MKALAPTLTALAWLGTLAGAWWHGHRSGTDQTATTSLLATRDILTAQGKPLPPGTGHAKTAAEGDPSARTTPSGSPPSLETILAQVKTLMRSGGMQNPATALKTITLLGQIRDEDVQAALQETKNIKDPPSKMMLNMVLLSRWAEKDGPAAIAYAEENLPDQGPMMQMTKMGVLSTWAQNDPDAAWQYLKTKDDTESTEPLGGRGMMVTGLFSSLAARDPEQAFARLAELDDPQERQMALNGIAQTAYDETSRSRLMDQVAQLPDPVERQETRAAMLGHLAMMDPDQAIQLTASLPQEERSNVAQRVGTMLMMSDPQRGATYLLQNTEPEKQAPVYQQIVSQWANSDPNAAGAWLGSQPQSPALDGARSSFATQVANRDPESAMAWAHEITNDTQRATTVEHVYNTWNKKDPAAAQSALSSSTLSPAQIEAIQTGSPPPTTPK